MAALANARFVSNSDEETALLLCSLNTGAQSPAVINCKLTVICIARDT